jgi:uncharacterized membrane protein YebE (DUF533 family)
MNIQSLFDQILKSAVGDDPVRRADMGKYATGAAVGGVLGLLLGTRSGRNMGGKVLKYGSVAAIGALAWKAYQEHQAQQSAASGGGAAQPAPSAPTSPTRFEALPAPQQERHSQAMLTAMRRSQGRWSPGRARAWPLAGRTATRAGRRGHAPVGGPGH